MVKISRKLNFENNFLLNKQLKLHMFTMVVRSAFEDNGKFYPQIYLDDWLV